MKHWETRSSIAATCLLASALVACAGSEKEAEAPLSAETEERINEPLPPVSDLEMSMEMEESEESSEDRQEYTPPPTRSYSPAKKLQQGTTEASSEAKE